MKRNFSIDNYISNPDYFNYLIEYQGDIIKEFEAYPDLFINIINDKYAILYIPKAKLDIIDDGFKFSTIVYIKPSAMYTLQEISPIEASQVNFLQLDLPLKLTGKGIDVAIIDTGIDYLNEEFMDEFKKSRVDLIWDQTIKSTKPIKDINIPFGTIYENNEIQLAIDEFFKGNDPYSIVPSKDDFGHGTEMAGIIGASGKNPKLKGVANECRFIVVKLIEDFGYKSSFGGSVPVYNVSSLFAALEFLYEYSLNNSKPLLIYLPLGSNLGTHKGNGILDQFIDFICINAQIAIITPTGNERNTGNHASGILTESDPIKVIDLDIPPEEKNLWLEIWVDVPNIVSLDIISPSGENSGVLNSQINKTINYTYIFEKTFIKANYYIPEEITGDELIRVRFYDLQPGIWKLRLIGNSLLDAHFNIWISQKGLVNDNTRLSPSDIYNTITNPGNSDYTITVAAYNQNNNNTLSYSGMSPDINSISTVDVAAGGVNALTVTSNNKTAIVNGTCVAAAIVTGVCAMILQWGIIDGNNPDIHSQTLKSYIIRGVSMRIGDIYPNPQWGYGMLNVLNVFKNMY
ncbi:S8 family peptidase [Clostridium sp. D53t1_180928_C8]|uniref:S8 family peptidase n=1 Tax=Clostridium sp. D53t1_180928_C8 TaxID=2787101 RepID=UPI0018A932AB|nr:S8 family peptidase [Clostridium sp. D53t1_180928_C8]